MAIPQPAPGNKTTAFVTGVWVYPGDVIINGNSSNGAHVVIKAHVLGSVPYPSGMSNDVVHWSVGYSVAQGA